MADASARWSRVASEVVLALAARILADPRHRAIRRCRVPGDRVPALRRMARPSASTAATGARHASSLTIPFVPLPRGAVAGLGRCAHASAPRTV